MGLSGARPPARGEGVLQLTIAVCRAFCLHQSGNLLWTVSAHFGAVTKLSCDAIQGILFSVKGAEVKKWWIKVRPPPPHTRPHTHTHSWCCADGEACGA